MVGYSGTPLPQKLGIKAGHRIGLVDAPDGFRRILGTLPDGATTFEALRGKPFDILIWFVTSQATLAKRFAGVSKHLDPRGGLWVAWPKKASGVATDVNENTVRAVALSEGLVDNKVCAIDETFSGLRCVVRLRDRPAAKGARR